MIQLSNDDTALPYFSKLSNRDRIGIVATADTMKDLVEVLHTTSTSTRPVLNGSSQQFIAEQLDISKSLVSQYLSIASIRSPTVKSALSISNTSINKAYYISRIKGKSFPEIETNQLAEIGRIAPRNDKLGFRLKAAQMILKNVSGAKAIKFSEVNCKDLINAPKAIIDNIKKCLEKIAPYTKKVKIISEQLGYCNFLIAHNECKCLCGSEISISELHSKKDLLIDEILSMRDQVMSERKYTSLLLLAKKDLEAAINSSDN